MIPLDPSPEPEPVMQGTVSSRETANEPVAARCAVCGTTTLPLSFVSNAVTMYGAFPVYSGALHCADCLRRCA